MDISKLKGLAIHGFLGSSRDFESFSKLNIKAIDLADYADCTWENLPTKLKDLVNTADFIIGYSLGGRVAFHTLSVLGQVKPLFLISSGLERADDSRTNFDKRWAERLSSSEPWASVMDDWNSQPLFQFDIPISGQDACAKRFEWASIVENWSPVHQRPLDKEMGDRNLKGTTYFYGQRDEKYKAVAKSLSEFKIPTIEVKGMGHRPFGFEEYIEDKILSILSGGECE
jgi:pimeloyl-ACP methyl ester carboxylesterase